jgi:hypothetical protein
MISKIAASTMLRCLTDALDYMEHEPQRARNLIVRVVYWLEDEVNGENQEGSRAGE